jgi:hypothetical protein
VSTLDGLRALPHRIHWQATPNTADVDHVDFIIDGELAWTEQNAPYFYGDDGNWLVTSFLKPGTHTFLTKVTTTDGQTAQTSTTATVGKAPFPPAALAHTWTRVVTAADLTKEPDLSNGSPPGRWTLTINDVGLVYHDPQQPGGANDVVYTGAGHLVIRPSIETPPFMHDGGWCHNPDPEWPYTYSVSGTTLTLHAEGQDPCGNRSAIVEGTWTRAR